MRTLRCSLGEAVFILYKTYQLHHKLNIPPINSPEVVFFLFVILLKGATIDPGGQFHEYKKGSRN